MAIKTPETDCVKECRFKFGNVFTTAVYYQPIYDKAGKLITSDGNKSSGECDCVECGRHWTYITAYDKTTFTEWNN